MPSSDLRGFSKKELKLVCLHSGLCNKSDNLSKKEMRLLLKHNKKIVIAKLHGGMPAASPFCNPFAVVSAHTPAQNTQAVNPLFTAYQNNYGTYLKLGQTENKFFDEYSAKSFASFLVLSERYKVKDQTQIRYLSNSTNASAYIYPITSGGACFLKVQNQGRCSDSFDHIENDCIISRLIRKLAETDQTFREKYVKNFVPILTSYTLPSEEFKTTNYLLLPHSQTNFQKTMSIPLLIGSPLLRILKNVYNTQNTQNTPAGIYFDAETYQIVVVVGQETKYFLKDLLFDLFESMRYLHSQIGMIHNDAHLGNLFFDKRSGKLVLIDYGRASIDLKKVATLKDSAETFQHIVESEVQKLNYKNIDGKYPSYPRDFANAYTIYSEESQPDVPLYMNDVASICFNIYRYLFEHFPYNSDKLVFKLEKSSSSSGSSTGTTVSSVTSSGDESGLNFTINMGEGEDAPSVLKKCSLESVLNPGLYWLANYITKYNAQQQQHIQTLEDLCGGQIMAPLLENGVFNSLSFNFQYVQGCTQKLIPTQEIPPTNRADSDYMMITCPKQQAGGGGDGDDIDDKEIQEAVEGYQEQKRECVKEPKYTTAQFQTPNQPIQSTTPGTPVKAPNGFNDKVNVNLLQQRFNARMCHLKTILKPSSS